MPTDQVATAEVIYLLRKLERIWPDHLMLFTGTGGVNLIQRNADGTAPEPPFNVNGIKPIASFKIDADGGDPW